jgi:glucosamine kinase
VLGVDGGGSRTRCWVVDGLGRVAGQAVAGPSNYQSVGAATAGTSLRQAVGEALAAAGVTPGHVAAACFALAGCDRPADRLVLEPLLEPLAPRAVRIVVSDAVAAWAGATGMRPGVVVAAGTGSVAYGRGPTGREARAGGWGPVFGDEGSGYDLVRRAVTAVLRGYDGRGPLTALAETILAAAGVDEPADLLYRFPAGGAAPGDLAALVPAVLAAAARGDAMATALVEAAGEELCALAEAVARRLGMRWGDAAVHGTGGLLQTDSPVRRALDRALRRRLGVPLRPCLHPPVAGAVFLAWQACGRDVDTLVRQGWDP